MGPGLERGEGLIEARARGSCRSKRRGRRAESSPASSTAVPAFRRELSLAGPVGWLVVGYLGSLAVLLVTSFWTLGELSGEIEQTFTLDNYKDVVSSRSTARSRAGR